MYQPGVELAQEIVIHRTIGLSFCELLEELQGLAGFPFRRVEREQRRAREHVLRIQVGRPPPMRFGLRSGCVAATDLTGTGKRACHHLAHQRDTAGGAPMVVTQGFSVRGLQTLEFLGQLRFCRLLPGPFRLLRLL